MDVFATFDEHGIPTGFWPQDGHGPAPPNEAIAIDEEQWAEFISFPGQRRWNGGNVVTHEPPPATELVPAEISDRQFGEGLWTDGLITFEEYLAFVGPGDIPPPLQAILDQLPDDDTGSPTPRKRAIGLVKGATSYRLDNPLVDVVRAARGWTPAELHERWRVWGGL